MFQCLTILAFAKGSLPELRIWSILKIKTDFKIVYASSINYLASFTATKLGVFLGTITPPLLATTFLHYLDGAFES